MMHNKNELLHNKTIVITGASSGAGRAIAIEYARHGAKLVLAARRKEALEELVEACNAYGAIAIAQPTDVTDTQQVNLLANKAYAFGGSIDVWVNNAGVMAAGEFAETPQEIYEKVIQTNLLGYMHGAHAALHFFKRQQYGLLINNISVGGWFPVPYGAAYSASKFGLKGFTEALRGEIRNYHAINICDLYPAFLDTPGMQHAANYTGKALKPAPPIYDPQEVAKAVVSVTLKPRESVVVGSIAHAMRAAHFLFPALSRNITAKIIESYLKQAPASALTAGNILNDVPYGTSIHGGWALSKRKTKTATTALLLTGIATGLYYLLQTKKKAILQ